MKVRKNIFILTLVLMLIGCSFTTVEANNLKHKAYIKGDQNKMFNPYSSLTREEVATILVRAYNLESDISRTNNAFKDLQTSRWSYKDLMTMYSLGFLGGYEDGTIRPNEKMTRAELTVLLNRIEKNSWEKDKIKVNTSFDYHNHWAKEDIQAAINKDIMLIYNDGKFKPNNYFSRAEFIRRINVLTGRKINKDFAKTIKPMFIDVKPTDWFYADLIEATIDHIVEDVIDGKEVWKKIN